MFLDDYARKRSFQKTPEPPPGRSAAPSGAAFCVQRHRARRLHYDLRIEVGGTLKSWAVPEGPTLDPAEKRLAVMVEDHPLLYATFEGNIPKGNYGAGSMMLWDNGHYELLGDAPAEAQLARGDFKFRLHGEKLRGEFALVRLKNSAKGNEWLLLKKKDSFAQPGWDIERFAYSVATWRTQEEIAVGAPSKKDESDGPSSCLAANVAGAVRAEMPAAIEPMLATPADSPPSGPDWIFEVKWDGVRALAFLTGGCARLVSRKGTPIDRQYPELGALHQSVEAQTAILDGEIVALDEAGRPAFERLQPRIMASGAAAVANLARTRPVTFFVFDLLYLDGWDLRNAPIVERKRLLTTVLKPSPVLRLSRQFYTGRELLEAARAQGLEGIVAKRASSGYRSARNRDWLKIKVVHEQEFVIGGYTRGERDYFGALVLGVYDGGKLVFAGSVGAGFDRQMMSDIRQRLDPLACGASPFAEHVELPQPVQWTRPELVCSVKYLNWTEDGRLRAPVFAGLRTDIDPGDCVRSAPQAPERALLLPGDKPEATVVVDGRSIRFKNLNKVFYPAEGYTKRDILNYYDAVAELLIPYLRDRPLSLRRYPDGITGEGFFQKRSDIGGLPDWMRTEVILAENHEERRQVIGAGRADLLFLVNLGCIDQNPWMSRVGSLDNPDFLLIDLDPHECPFAKIVEAALFVRRKLELLGLAGYPKTTGGDGMHIYVPLDPVYTYEQTKQFAEILARWAVAERPDLFTMPRAVSRRTAGKVYFDYLQNGRGKTISAPYVLRAYPGAPVAAPLDWRELTSSLDPRQFHLRNALDRFDRTGDLFAPVLTNLQRLEPAMARLDGALRGAAG